MALDVMVPPDFSVLFCAFFAFCCDVILEHVPIDFSLESMGSAFQNCPAEHQKP